MHTVWPEVPKHEANSQPTQPPGELAVYKQQTHTYTIHTHTRTHTHMYTPIDYRYTYLSTCACTHSLIKVSYTHSHPLLHTLYFLLHAYMYVI